MKFFGDINLQQNELQQAVIQIEDGFPVNPKVGRMANVNHILYLCVSLTDGLPLWVPMTRELTMYTHTQSEAADEWTINHGLNTVGVQTQVFDATGRVLIPDDIFVSTSNQVVVSWNTPITGRAVILSGHQDGMVKPTYSFTHYQNPAASTWNITHNLGHNPIVRVFVGNSEVQPSSVVHNSLNEMTITFSAPLAGVAKLV